MKTAEVGKDTLVLEIGKNRAEEISGILLFMAVQLMIFTIVFTFTCAITKG